ncbi:MAG: hypothetical protein E6Q97_33515, partial [Desulfurellales bacterium]
MKATLWKQSDSVLHVQLKGGGSLARAMVDALDLGEGGTRSATTSPTLGAAPASQTTLVSPAAGSTAAAIGRLPNAPRPSHCQQPQREENMTTDDRNRLLADCNSDLWSVRRRAFAALGPLAKDDAEVRKALIARTADEDCDVRGWACAALGPLAKDDAEVRKALLDRTADEDCYVRGWACAALEPLAKDDAAVGTDPVDGSSGVDVDVRRCMKA